VSDRNRRLTAAAAGRGGLLLLAVLALLSWFAYLGIALLSRRFILGQGHTERPILLVLSLLAAAFVLHLVALGIALRRRQDWPLWGVIVLGSVAFRVTLVPSVPIQEIDIYRYLWDGAATAAGVSPFRYSPQQVLDASAEEPLPGGLRRLVEVRDGSPSLATVLTRIHFAELPTVYPPVSQAVFAAVARFTPPGASVHQRLVAMKSVFVLFDLGTLLLVMGLLRRTGRHVGWAIAYGWCPLVVKEVANSGHLDAIAVFLTTWAVYLAVRSLCQSDAGGKKGLGAVARAVAAAALLALGVGAKLYPVVLLPLFAAGWLRRLGGGRSLAPLATFAVLTVAVLWPMVYPQSVQYAAPQGEEAVGDAAVPPLPPAAADHAPRDPAAGLKAFLGGWEMNDFLFLIVVENLKPSAETPPGQRPWFAVVPESWRRALVGPLAERVGGDRAAAAFLLARGLTTILFLGLVGCWTLQTYRHADAATWLSAAFLVLAWFWLLSPTQNPWYWTWALPLVAFARSRTWLLVSGVLPAYYLRFWLTYHWPLQSVAGTPYHGSLFFDFVVTWLEFAPILGLLLLEWSVRRGRSAGA